MTDDRPVREWTPQNPAFESVVRDAFEKQTAMHTIGAELTHLAPGAAHLTLACHDQIMSHVPPIVHGGTISMIADSAMGFAALSLAPEGGTGVTVEYKITFLAPAIGDHLVARGRVLKYGKQMVFTDVRVVVVNEGREKTAALATGTFIAL
ncbi:PaaI family thioesterase [Actinocorallia sp. API 0066]|uniref:PaaI family thioesterase n=1 Tax=Actinocorallia sp. API 0066 TaxID=2896846 RepID=UPI001E595375|nr:PaaI family thioesterase [Actinocorallia sp. API 0066]MCD0448224.1 PaaI family thioesterase [Actinocorallia sp. API 0066]